MSKLQQGEMSNGPSFIRVSNSREVGAWKVTVQERLPEMRRVVALPRNVVTTPLGYCKTPCVSKVVELISV